MNIYIGVESYTPYYMSDREFNISQYIDVYHLDFDINISVY